MIKNKTGDDWHLVHFNVETMHENLFTKLMKLTNESH